MYSASGRCWRLTHTDYFNKVVFSCILIPLWRNWCITYKYRISGDDGDIFSIEVVSASELITQMCQYILTERRGFMYHSDVICGVGKIKLPTKISGRRIKDTNLVENLFNGFLHHHKYTKTVSQRSMVIWKLYSTTLR